MRRCSTHCKNTLKIETSDALQSANTHWRVCQIFFTNIRWGPLIPWSPKQPLNLAFCLGCPWLILYCCKSYDIMASFYFIFYYHFLDKIEHCPALQPVRPQLHPWTQLSHISYFSYVSYLKHAFCMIFMSLTYDENANWHGQSGMCGDFVQILDCALWGWTGLVFHYGCWFHWWNLSKLLMHRTEQAFFLLVGCAVFPLETIFKWSCKK